MRIRLFVYIAAALSLVFVSCGQKKEDASEEAARLLREKGIEVPLHPSVNCGELMRQYKANPDLWDAALECVAKNAPILNEITDFGVTKLVGDRCYVNIDEFNPRPFSETKLEGHKKYIDIQLTEGPVRWGVCPADSENLKVLTEYNPEGEIGFYLSDDTVYYDQEADKPYIFVFFPNDLHNPSFAADGAVYERPLKKLVIKVANASE